MTTFTTETLATDTITFELDGRIIEAAPGETILLAARRAGVDIPHLCFTDGLRADGNCRACVVEIDGERVLAPSCCRAPKPGMKVKAASERARASQRMVLELLRADVAPETEKADSELAHWCDRLGVTASRFAPREQPATDTSHPGIAVNLAACIQCNRCVRACREEQVNDVIGYAHRGEASKIVFDLDVAMGSSTCVGCGECVQACPTGALLPATVIENAAVAEAKPPRFVPTRKVDSLCPFCGVGCQLTYHVAGEGAAQKIVFAEGRDGPANAGRLCVKGRYGFTYSRNRERLTVPLIRKPGIPKGVNLDPANPLAAFREASWEEALDFAAAGLARIKRAHGPHALAGFGSAKGSNEEAYLFQKLVRTGFGTHNVDHCTRLCHASSVAALLEGIGSGAVSNPVRDVEFADLMIVIGANPAANHPVAASFIKNAAERGSKLVMMDPRQTPLARHAWRTLQFRPDADVALLLSTACVIIEEGLTDPAFIAARTEGFDAFREAALQYPPERMAPITGIEADTVREVARAYARGPNSIIFWGMGVSQHTHGTDNVRCLIALALMTGQIGRPGTGLHPLRGQNNVQGASDAGLIPMMFPDYQRVAEPEVRARFESLWGAKLAEEPGLTVVEIMDAASAGRIRGMYVEGENPAMSDPDLEHARAALAGLEHLVVQDIFLTETAMLADVVLPASSLYEKSGSFTNTDRLVQMSQPVLPLPGEARQDWWIIQQIAQRMGLAWDYAGPAEIFGELTRAMPSYAGITWAALEGEGAVVAPKIAVEAPSQPVLFQTDFPTRNGLGRFVPVTPLPAAELPDADYPMVLITGRVLEHWHTGSMTRRAEVLDALDPVPWCGMHPDDMAKTGVSHGEHVELETRRGQIELEVRADEGVQRGSVFMAFCYVEAAANLLTQPALDPFGKIPEFKYCALRVRFKGVFKGVRVV
ncbi:formate dehydrogenase subunit alpha [Parazoarcus communis]|uniref:Formate dehydrogenase subunit alpha n=1 Tax=Parazoarcus communis TaxID=41977 RepID=A0A2U8GS20_9RHOO|nr:formate dehydrogenase subunit alpha [Parazoarcus communis]AWI75295.1 formate dehydrogenase subunit alpha [Parazoarcus communis]